MLPLAVAAQSASAWPTKPIRLVSPFAAGGAIDVLNRVIAEKLSQRLGQQVFVEPIPGANTIKGADVVAKAPADGYTFMITTMSTHVNNTVLFAKLPFDPVKDFTPITQVSLGSVLLTAPANAPYADLKGFVAWAKAQQRPITYGSWGVGSSANVYGEILAKDYGVSLTHVPYKGELAAITDVIGGSLDVTFASPVG
ncbi:MAG: Bug family tripartite tricarboxylate transporter substrate binding protein, partial [Polyangia bacterium]